MVTATHPCVFLDRDGVIVIPHFRSGRSFAPRQLKALKFYECVNEALKRLKQAGFLLAVITNQPDVGNQLTDKSTVEAMHHEMLLAFPMIDHIETCYHTRDDGCTCRKPLTGSFDKITKKFSIALSQSFMVGDRTTDIEAGKSLGLTTLFIDHGYTAERLSIAPDYICHNLLECAEMIIQQAFRNKPIFEAE